MKKVLSILGHDMWFHIFASSAIILIAASFVIPPIGIIDSSVLAAVGELTGFAAIWEIHIAIKKGMGAKLSKDDITLEINND